MKRFLTLDWDAIAGIAAAILAIVLHFLHVVEEDVLLSILLVLIALIFVRDLRHERGFDEMETGIKDGLARMRWIESSLRPPDAVLVGPQSLRAQSEAFSREAAGEMTWFHVCLLMFRPQELFNVLLRPAIENPRVTSIQFVLDESERQAWEEHVVPKVRQCPGHEKVQPPRWRRIDEAVSVIFSGSADGGSGDCLLSFWGEPFMSHATNAPVPRYIFRVNRQSELVGRLADIDRKYRLGG
jgi:hypothetical protein